MGTNGVQKDEFTGWHLLAAVLAIGTAADLWLGSYSLSAGMLALDCGSGYDILVNRTSVACREEYLGQVALRLLAGGGLTTAAWMTGERKAREQASEPPNPSA